MVRNLPAAGVREAEGERGLEPLRGVRIVRNPFSKAFLRAFMGRTFRTLRTFHTFRRLRMASGDVGPIIGPPCPLA